nr:hypothetical protein JVH1_2592 [Rhodococcus sp. JVH1]
MPALFSDMAEHPPREVSIVPTGFTPVGDVAAEGYQSVTTVS